MIIIGRWCPVWRSPRGAPSLIRKGLIRLAGPETGRARGDHGLAAATVRWALRRTTEAGIGEAGRPDSARGRDRHRSWASQHRSSRSPRMEYSAGTGRPKGRPLPRHWGMLDILAPLAWNSAAQLNRLAPLTPPCAVCYDANETVAATVAFVFRSVRECDLTGMGMGCIASEKLC